MITVINSAGSNAQASSGLAHFDFDGREVNDGSGVATSSHADQVSRGNSGRTLSVMVIEGWGFKQASSLNKPHVILKLGRQVHKTGSVSNGAGHPLWVQMFNFKVPSTTAADKDQRLQVRSATRALWGLAFSQCNLDRSKSSNPRRSISAAITWWTV
jgi:hypothetical protein